MRLTRSDRGAGRRRRVLWLLAAFAAPGCGGEPEVHSPSVSAAMTVQVIQPKVRTIVRVVEQPSFIQAYEHTAIYAKLTSYIQEWKVDIGDPVKKGQVLATLFMPELIEERRTKQADVVLAKDLVEQSLKLADVAQANVEAAAARLDEARLILAKFQAETDRWDTEVQRLTRESQRGVISPQILLESTNQFKSSTAARDAARASIMTAQADLLSRRSQSAKAQVDVAVARSRLLVAESDEKRVEALVGYLTLIAPFDGVIVARNANTGDFVLPGTGDPTATQRAPYLSPGQAAPIYVVDRTDVVRIFVDIPEEDANSVRIGTKASVRVRAYRDTELPASVTRTSWALNVKSRTLRAEIDLHNPEGRILPGMYAYGKVIIERQGARALPLDALVYGGDQTFCWRYENGHAVRTEIETGVSDGSWIEVTNRRVPAALDGPAGDPWAPIDGSEQVILGDLSLLTDGAPVRIAASTGEADVASAVPAPAPPASESRSGARARSR